MPTATLISTASIIDPGAQLGANTSVAPWTHIHSTARIGDNCVIGEHALIGDNVTLGNHVSLQCNISIPKNTVVGSDTTIDAGVTFASGEATTTIGDHVKIGAGATILPVSIGNGAQILPGSVVTKDVPFHAIVTGSPARIIGYADAVEVAPTVEKHTQKQETRTGSIIYTLPTFSDLRGDLNVIEFEKTLPFPVKRLFYTYGVDSMEMRGEHAHRKCEQFLIAVHGSLHVIVDNGTVREEIILDSPAKGLHLPSGCWGVQYKHSPDCVLLVLASRPYEADDYIRDYAEFLQYKKEQR